MNLTLKNRIAFYYLIASSLLIILFFTSLYLVVDKTVYNHLDEDLDAEVQEVRSGIVIMNDAFLFANPYEWTENEHKQIEVNPTFIRIVDVDGRTIKKTGNLFESDLIFNSAFKEKHYFNSVLSNSTIRQIQQPLISPSGKIVGFIIVAIPLEESALVLQNLLITLIIALPIVLIILFLSSRLIAGKSISPISEIISTAEKISKENLSERIHLPQNKDELYRLADTINNLLIRLEDTLLREKQFTSDASHELRTPLAAIKGTLEVVLRKHRTVELYEEKIRYCIREVDRMTNLTEQLLLLARYDSGKFIPKYEEVKLNPLIEKVISSNADALSNKKLKLVKEIPEEVVVYTDSDMLEIALSNIISNSIKYSYENSEIKIKIYNKDGIINCAIKDNGRGISEEQISRIFDRFYRGDESRNSEIKGVGLGLAIVRKISQLLNITLHIESKINEGANFIISFPFTTK